MIRARVMDTLQNDYLVLDLGQDSSLHIPLSLVEKVSKGQQGSIYNDKGRSALATGITYEMSLSTLSAKSFSEFDRNVRVYPSLQFSANYHLLPYLTLGAGTALEYYDEWMLPVFFQARIYEPRKVTAPYFNFQLGYGIATQRLFNREEFDKSRGGLMWYPSIGLRLANRRHTSFVMDIGYKFQHFHYEYDYPDDWWTTLEKEHIVYRSLAIRFGILF